MPSPKSLTIRSVPFTKHQVMTKGSLVVPNFTTPLHCIVWVRFQATNHATLANSGTVI